MLFLPERLSQLTARTKTDWVGIRRSAYTLLGSGYQYGLRGNVT